MEGKRVPAYHLHLSSPAPVFLCLLSARSDPSVALGHLLLPGIKAQLTPLALAGRAVLPCHLPCALPARLVPASVGCN